MAKTGVQNHKVSLSLMKVHGRDEPDAGLPGTVRALSASRLIHP